LRGKILALTAMSDRFRTNDDLASVIARFADLDHREFDALPATVNDCP
jgi:hypothetical protein